MERMSLLSVHSPLADATNQLRILRQVPAVRSFSDSLGVLHPLTAAGLCRLAISKDLFPSVIGDRVGKSAETSFAMRVPDST